MRVYTTGWLAHHRRAGRNTTQPHTSRQRAVRYIGEALYCRLHPTTPLVFCYAHEHPAPQRRRRRRVLLRLCLTAWCPRCTDSCHGWNALPLSTPGRVLVARPAPPRHTGPPRPRRWRWDAAARQAIENGDL